MDICKLKSPTKSYIWGGNRLFNYGKISSENIIAESWELSYLPGDESIIDSGNDLGKKLSEIATSDDLGENCKEFSFFPILVKLIDAKNDLSIQVHPSDEYAIKNENSLGKTEMWYVVDADEGALLHIGFNKDVTKEEVNERIKNNTITEIMNHIPVKAGDCYFIPSGTIHAIGKGCFICEIQENSNLTYRVYDYGRIGKDGKPRELHLEKALKVLNLRKMDINNLGNRDPLVSCKYFIVKKLINPTEIRTNLESFASLTVLEGQGKINNLDFNKGDTFFIPANKQASIKGDCVCILTTI